MPDSKGSRKAASSLKVMLTAPAIAPQCFAQPECCAECRGCGLRLLCYERHATQDAVHLLPRPRIPSST